MRTRRTGRLGAMLLLAIIALAGRAGADDVLVWDAEPFPGSGPEVSATLQSLGYTVEYTTTIDTVNLVSYDYVFVFLGIFFDNHTIETGSAEETALVNYLSNGGRLYIEGGDFAAEAPANLFPMFGVQFVDDGDEILSTASGVAGTFTEGMSLDYGGSSFFLDNIAPVDSATMVLSNPIDDSGIAVIHDAGAWRTALFTFEVGYIIDGDAPNTRSDLLNGLMGWFGPGIPSPTNLVAELNHTNGQVDLSWDYTPDPTYTLTEFRIYRGASEIGSSNTQSFTDILPDFGRHSYRVTAWYSDLARESSYAGPTSLIWLQGGLISPDPFSLLAPADGSSFAVTELDFQWEATSDGNPGDSISYHLLLDTDPLFSDPRIEEMGEQTSATLAGFEDDSTYHWRVHAQDLNTAGTSSEETWSFTMRLPDPPEAFELASPPNLAAVPDQSPTLTWHRAVETDIDDSVSYTLHYALNPDFNDESTVAGLTDTSWTFPWTLNLGTEIYWRVKANDTNTAGTWCSPEQGWMMEVNLNNSPEPFSLLAPGDDVVATSSTVSFRWEQTSDADEGDFLTYEIELSEDSIFSEPAYDFADTDTSLELSDLPDDSDYWWRVRAFDTNTNGSYSNEAWHFSHAVPEPPTAFHLLSPASGTELGIETNYTARYDWQDSVDPDPGDVVRYNLIFEAMLPSGTETYTLRNLTLSERVLSIVDSFSVIGWDEWVSVHWHVVALSGGDEIRSVEPWRSVYISPLGVSVGEQGALPTRYSLAPVFPNPFNPTATVRIALPRSGQLRVELFDLLGRRVARIAEGRFAPGYHDLLLDGSALPSGSYFLRAQVPGELNQVRKVILLR